MEKSPLPTEEQCVSELEGVSESAGSGVDGQGCSHTPLRVAVRGLVSSGVSRKAKKLNVGKRESERERESLARVRVEIY